jgi:hypothetical protein
MPRFVSAMLVAIAAALALPCAADAGPVLQSDNVTTVGKLADATGAIGARFSPDGTLMYVTSATGLGIYDITEPERPLLQSRLPLPHFENEDVDVGRDTVVITNDPSFTAAGSIYLIDVSNPRLPRIRSVLNTSLAGMAASDTGNGHIASCIHDCRYLYTTGTSEGLSIYDIRDLDAPRFVKTFAIPGNGFTHDVNVDSSGLAWVTGEDGTFGFDVADPLNPRLVMRSDEAVTNTGGGLPGDDGSGPLDFLHHNSLRVSKKVLAVTEEDYAKPTCEGQGSLQTWGISGDTNSDGSRKLVLLDQWTTELNELATLEGRSPATGNCSAHWFDESDGLLAQGWYDQGVRFLDVSDPKDIRQVGYHATQGTFWGAYFAPTDPERETVYAIDVTSGVDVLHIERPDGPGRMPEKRKNASKSDLDRTSGVGFTANDRWGNVCMLPTAETVSVTSGVTGQG